MRTRRFTEAVSEKAGISPETAYETLKIFAVIIAEQLADGNEVCLGDFGTFTLCETKPRRAVNLRTHEQIELPVIKRPGFTPGSRLLGAVNRSEAEPELKIVHSA